MPRWKQGGSDSLLEQGCSIGYRFVGSRCSPLQQRYTRRWHKTQKYHIGVRAGWRGGHDLRRLREALQTWHNGAFAKAESLMPAITIAKSLRANHF
jgi:hypothetical protein